MLKDIEPISTSSKASPEVSQPQVQICFPIDMLYFKKEEKLQLPQGKNNKISLCFKLD